jgi:hypothetical protein
MHLPGELKVFFIYLVGVDCQLGIDLIFPLGSNKKYGSLQSRNARKNQI